MYVMIEGPDRVGKTTLIKNIEKYELSIGVDVTTIREPGQTELGRNIREMIMSSPNMSPVSRMFLFLADRAETFKQFGHLMNKGKQLLVSDRGYISGIAYAMMDEVAIKYELEWMNELAMNNTFPDLVILIKATKDTIIERTKEAGAENFFDEKGVEFMLEVQGLVESNLSGLENTTYVVLEAELSREEILKRAIKTINYIDRLMNSGEEIPCGEIIYKEI